LIESDKEVLKRMTISMYIGKKCHHCSHEYDSVDDLIKRDPKRGHGEGMNLVCANCWDNYSKVEDTTIV